MVLGVLAVPSVAERALTCLDAVRSEHFHDAPIAHGGGEQ
jgi:hypothetical protein